MPKFNLALVMGALLAGPVHAEDHVVKASVTNYEPMVLFAKPGDTVTWTNMAGHDTTSLEGMIPEGATPWHSKLGEQFTVTLEKEGAYVYKCTPHVATGMVGAIVVGDKPNNLAAIDASLEKVDSAKNMVARAIRKMKQELDKRAAR
jgi:pseudoazurin